MEEEVNVEKEKKLSVVMDPLDHFLLLLWLVRVIFPRSDQQETDLKKQLLLLNPILSLWSLPSSKKRSFRRQRLLSLNS